MSHTIIEVPESEAVHAYRQWWARPSISQAGGQPIRLGGADLTWPIDAACEATCDVEGCTGVPSGPDDHHRYDGCGIDAVSRVVDVNRAALRGALEGRGLADVVIGEVSLWGRVCVLPGESSYDDEPIDCYRAQFARPVRLFHIGGLVTFSGEFAIEVEHAYEQLARDYGVPLERNPRSVYLRPDDYHDDY